MERKAPFFQKDKKLPYIFNLSSRDGQNIDQAIDLIIDKIVATHEDLDIVITVIEKDDRRAKLEVELLNESKNYRI